MRKAIKKVKQILLKILIEVASFLTGAVMIFVLAPIVETVGSLRRLLYTIDLRCKLWKGKYYTIVQGAVLFFYLELGVGIPVLAVQILGLQHLFEGIVVGALLIAFFAFQYPRMLPPTFTVTFTTRAMTDKSYYKVVKKESEELLFFSITNLTLLHLKKCFCAVEFEEGIEVIGGEGTVTSMEKHVIQYSANLFEAGLAPFINRQVAACIRTPKKVGDYKIRFGLMSESTWRIGESSLTLKVVDNT